MDSRREINHEALAVQKRFVARQEEQSHFRTAFRNIIDTPSDSSAEEPNQRLFLINGEGGWGKSTLVNRFIQICSGEDPLFESLVIKIDWEHFKLDKESSEPDQAVKVMDIIHDTLAPEYPSCFKDYRAERERLAGISQEKTKASQEFDGWIDLTSEVLAHVAPVGGSFVRPAGKAIARTVLPKIEEQGQKFTEWFRRKLHPDDYGLYDDPKGQLSRLLVKALLEATTKRPLIMMFDTAEQVLHVKWIYSGLIKYTIPESSRFLLVIAGRIPEEVRNAIRDNIRDTYIFRSELDTFSRLDIEDYLHLSNGTPESTKSLVDFIYDTTKGIPLAVDALATAFTQGYDLRTVFSESGSQIDRGSIIQTVAYRFLKHCFEDPKHIADKDYIYTFAVLADEVDNQTPVIEYVWKRLVDEKINVGVTINHLQSDYSFLFLNRKMHSVVKYFVCFALTKGLLDAGRLIDINRVALEYYCAKSVSFKDYQTKFRNRTYQEAAIGKLNHLFWLRDIDSGIDFLCEVYNFAVRYGEFDFARRFLGVITDKEWLRARLSPEQDELITLLQHFGSLIGKRCETLQSVASLKEQIFTRLDTETKTLTLIDEAINAARADHLSLAARQLEQAEAMVTADAFMKERVTAYRTLGMAARRLGDLEMGLKYLGKAHALDDKDSYTLIEIGHIYSQKKNAAKAIEAYAQVRDRRPDLKWVGQFIQAESRKLTTDHLEYHLDACYSRLKGLDPQSERYYRTRSRISSLLMQQGRLKEALSERLVAEEYFKRVGRACTLNKTTGFIC